MYGDVFGNRAPESVLPGLDTNDAVDTPTFQWQPALDLSRRAPKYGYDPWTKAAYRFDARIRWWCFLPASPVWHASVQYGIGSVLFVIGSAAALFTAVNTNPFLSRWLVDYTYFVGSINYGIGASILLYESWINHPSNLSDPYTQATPQRTAAITISRIGSCMTTDGGMRGSDREPLTGSFEESAIADNASRPPSFASTQRWWPGGPDIGDGDGDPSGQSIPQLSDEIGWGGYGAHAHRSSAADVDFSQPLLEDEVMLAPAGSDEGKNSGELTVAATLALPLDSSSGPLREASADTAGTAEISPHKPLHIFTGHRNGADSPHAGLNGGARNGHRGHGGNGADPDEVSIADTEEGDCESVPCDETETARSYDGSFDSEARSYHHVFGRRWRATSTAENVTASLLDVPHRLPAQMNALVHSYYTRDAYYHVHADPWYHTRWLLDLGGSFAIWVGAMLYFVACFALAYKGAYGHLPRIHPNPEVVEAVLGFWPDTVGGALFVVGSWLYWWAAHGTPGPLAPKPFTVEWVVSVVNLFGSMGFYYGAASTSTIIAVPHLVGNWVQLLVGYVIGSALFMVGSYLMIVELASHSGG